MSQSTEDRLQKLEAEVAELRAGRIRAQEVQLIDDDGKVRGLFAMTEDGPALQFFDTAGQCRAKIVVTNNDPGLTLLDEKGLTRAWLGFAKEALRIGFADEAGNNRAFFGVMKKSGPVISFYDTDQKLMWSAPAKPEA